MRKALGVLTACAVVLVAACSSSSPDTTYNAPDMGSASALPSAGSVPSVTTTAAGKTLLMDAFSSTSSLIGFSSGGATIAGTGKAIPLALLNGTQNYSFVAATGHSGLSVSGTVSLTGVNWPSTFSSGSTYDCSLSLTQKMTLTADHVAVSSSTKNYTVSGKEISNVSMSMKVKGTYPSSVTASGDYKLGAGMAFTIVNTTDNTSVKAILTFSASGSLASMPSGFPTTATVYFYNSGDNTLIGSVELSGTDLGDLIYMIMSS